MKYFIVDAFTDRPFGGNPAGVVLLEKSAFPSKDIMLHVAAELRFSETAFVMQHSPDEFTVRYFTPRAEVELCGHATIASFALLHSLKLAEGHCLCHTQAGDLSIEAGERVMMQMATPRIVQTIANTDALYRAMGLEGYRPTLPVQIAYAGLSDIMLPIPDIATLNNLRSDMEAVTHITDKYKAVSIHPFAFADDEYTAHVRDFAPLYGVPEESATGTANAALTYYLGQCGRIATEGDFAFLQGEAMGRPSVVATRMTANGTLHVGGTAYILASGELRIEKNCK